MSETELSSSSTAAALAANLGQYLWPQDGDASGEARETILRQLHAHRAQLLDAMDAGSAHKAAEFELEELERAIDHYEMAEHRSRLPFATDTENLSAITRELSSIQSLLLSTR